MYRLSHHSLALFVWNLIKLIASLSKFNVVSKLNDFVCHTLVDKIVN